MASRRFDSSARVALFLAARGRCAECGAALERGWHADHVAPVRAGGADGARERAGAVPALQPRQGRAACVTVAPRPWQAAFLAQHAAAEARDFLLVATPGRARRSLRAMRSARPAASRGRRVPDHGAARAVGGCRGPRGPASRSSLAQRRRAWRADVDGVVVTYQQVASAPDLFAHHLARSTFVVLDEIHHAGESASWGTALRAAFDGARRRLGLSGTPFRSDARAIPFVRYDADRRCAPDFATATARRSPDAVCRPLAFRLLDATLRWRSTRRRRSPRSPTSSTRETTRGGCARRSTP